MESPSAVSFRWTRQTERAVGGANSVEGSSDTSQTLSQPGHVMQPAITKGSNAEMPYRVYYVHHCTTIQQKSDCSCLAVERRSM